jgi:hypothetical protein
MTQIVRKFILLSILITVLVTILIIGIMSIYRKSNIIESFGIRDLNGRRNRALRKCIGNSTSGVINQSQECNLEGFENEYIKGIISGVGNIVDNPIEKVFNHILNQIPNWTKDNSNIENVFNDPPIDIHFKEINLDTKHIKFKNPLPLFRYQKDFRKLLEKDLPQLSRAYNNMNPQKQKSIRNMLLKDAFIAFKVNIKDDNILVLPRQEFIKKNITLAFENNENILLHVNINKSNTKSKKYKLYSLAVEKTLGDINIKYADISIDVGLFNLGNNSKFVSFKKIKIIDN